MPKRFDSVLSTPSPTPDSVPPDSKRKTARKVGGLKDQLVLTEADDLSFAELADIPDTAIKARPKKWGNTEALLQKLEDESMEKRKVANALRKKLHVESTDPEITTRELTGEAAEVVKREVAREESWQTKKKHSMMRRMGEAVAKSNNQPSPDAEERMADLRAQSEKQLPSKPSHQQKADSFLKDRSLDVVSSFEAKQEKWKKQEGRLIEKRNSIQEKVKNGGWTSKFKNWLGKLGGEATETNEQKELRSIEEQLERISEEQKEIAKNLKEARNQQREKERKVEDMSVESAAKILTKERASQIWEAVNKNITQLGSDISPTGYVFEVARAAHAKETRNMDVLAEAGRNLRAWDTKLGFKNAYVNSLIEESVINSRNTRENIRRRQTGSAARQNRFRAGHI